MMLQQASIGEMRFLVPLWMKWILKVDCELEKEEKKGGIKLQKKFGHQQEFK